MFHVQDKWNEHKEFSLGISYKTDFMEPGDTYNPIIKTSLTFTHGAVPKSKYNHHTYNSCGVDIRDNAQN